MSNQILGEKSGAIIAGTWAIIKSLGYEGYENIVRKILSATASLRRKIEKIEAIELLGPNMYNIISFRAK